MAKASLPRLSIVFPNLNGDKVELKTLLASIKNSSYPQKNLEVIMVDNGSTNDSPTYVAKNFPMVKIIKLTKNWGFSRAVNIGIAKSKGQYIFVTNDDVKVQKDCFKNLINLMSTDPTIGIAGCKVYDFKSPKKIVSSALKYNFYTGRFKMAKVSQKPQITDWVAGCAITFPKLVWEKIKGFDESFFFSSEELDLCLRTKYAGFNVTYHPKAIVWHGGSTTIRRPEYVDFFTKQIYRGKIRLILKHGTILEIIVNLLIQYLLIPYRTFVLGESTLPALLDATIWNFKNLPKNISSQRKNIINLS